MSQPADWYPDPSGRHEHRYWDGSRWTEHVASHGRQSTDFDSTSRPPPTVARPTEKIVRDVAKAGPPRPAGPLGGGTIFTEPVLVVNQKAKLIELNNEYAIYDGNGRQLGAVRQVGQSMLKKAVRLLGSYDQFMTHKLQVVDMAGTVLLAVTRPAKVFKSRILINDAVGQEVGQVVQQNMVGKIRFSLEAGGAADRVDQRRELAGVELLDPGPHRHRGRPHHQDVGRPGQDDVHHGRQLRRADPPPAGGAAADPGGGLGAVGRHRPQAGPAGARA